MNQKQEDEAAVIKLIESQMPGFKSMSTARKVRIAHSFKKITLPADIPLITEN